MKNLKTVFAAFAFMFAAAGTQAQDLKKAATDPDRLEAKKAKEALDTELNLTPEQKTQMAELRKKYALKAREVKAVQKEERKKQMMALHDERDAEVKKLLTADQYKTFIEFRAKRKEQIREKVIQRKKG